jgi:zinc protease
MRPHLVLAVACASLPSVAFADAPKIQSHTCPNGLTVFVVENHAVPLVTVEIAAKNGSMTEPPELNGLSHLYEHMFFKANAVIPSQEAYMARMHELGMSFNGTTNTERVNYFFTTTSDHLADAMVFMRDAITSPLFDQKELERERVVVTGEMDRNEASPFYHFQKAVDALVWYRYPTRKDPLGSRKTVLTATSEKMHTIQRLYYVPNNSALVVTGDVSAEAIFKSADELYVGWKKAEDPFKKHPLVTHPPLATSEVVVVDQPVKTFTGVFEWHGPSTIDKELDMTYAADALGTALAEPSSRFQKALVDSGACISANLGWYTQRNVGPVSVGFSATPANIDRCVKAVQAELKKLGEPGYVTQEELTLAAHTLEIDRIKSREKPSELAHTITFWWASASIDYYLGYVDHLKKVTPADATRFVSTYITQKPFVFGALVSPEMRRHGATAEHLAEITGTKVAKSSVKGALEVPAAAKKTDAPKGAEGKKAEGKKADAPKAEAKPKAGPPPAQPQKKGGAK